MTIAELVARIERRAADAEREGATAPVANIYRLVLEDLRPLAGGLETTPPSADPERTLTAAQVAKLLATSERWVYDHQEQLGGRRLSRRCLRFPVSGVRRYLDRRR